MELSAPALGTILNGEYILEEKLGESSSRVYRARRQREGRSVTLRLVWPPTPPMAAEFRELAGLASRVRHPILANVESFGRYGSEACFLASEYVEGQRLDEWADSIGIPPLAQVIELVRRLCIGLQAAARGGVTHDALNPRNIMVLKAVPGVGSRMPIKLLDLGVPALLFPEDTHARSMRYMAPEQLAVLASKVMPVSFRCTPSMNVYSCGCLLYYLCTGGPPYPGATVDELRAAHASGRLVPPVRINPQISPTLSSLIMKTLSLDPSDRFGSVAELADALSTAPGNAPLHVRPSRAPAPVSTTPPPPALGPVDDDPPTFRTPRPIDLLLLQQQHSPEIASNPTPTALSIPLPNTQPPTANDTPTSPPLAQVAVTPLAPLPSSSMPPPTLSIPGPESAAATAPIGLFSSAPPEDERRSTAPPPSYQSERPAPLALFSSPPSADVHVRDDDVDRATPLTSPGSEIIVAEAEPIASRLVGPYQGYVARRALERRSWLYEHRMWLMAAVVLLAGFFGVRSMLPAEAVLVQPVKLDKPAANSGALADRRPAPRVVAPPTGAIAPEPIAAASDATKTRSAEIPVAVRAHEHTHSRGAHANPSQSPRASESASSAPRDAKEEPFALTLAPPAPAEPVADAAANHAHPGAETVAPVPPPKPNAAEPAPQPPTAAPAQPSSDGPLAARVSIQAVEVRGSLPTSQVRRSVERIRPLFAACYVQAAQAAGHNGFGESIVELQIDERGRVRAPRVRGGSLPRLDACVAEVAGKLVSEKAPDTGTVNASFKVAFTP